MCTIELNLAFELRSHQKREKHLQVSAVKTSFSRNQALKSKQVSKHTLKCHLHAIICGNKMHVILYLFLFVIFFSSPGLTDNMRNHREFLVQNHFL